jgi:hypothetical protein
MRAALTLTAIVAIAAGCHTRKILGAKHEHAATTPDAGVTATATPDAEEAAPPPAAPDAAPATITFDRAAWQPGDKVKIWRKAVLVDAKGSASADDGFGLTLDVASVTGTDVIANAGHDCVVRIGGGTAKVTGACEGNDFDYAYKLDIIGQLLAIPRDTVTVGDRTAAFNRPIVALFKLQDANAVMTAYLASVTDRGAIYAAHLEVEGTMIKHGLRVTSSLDGTIEIDPHATRMVGRFGPSKATINGGPITDYHSKGTLELSFGIEPSR